jgi:hypothetical protein
MGIAPSEFKRMSLWEFQAVTERWIEAHDAGGNTLPEAEKDEIWDFLQTRTDIPLSRAAARKGNGVN